MTSDNTQDRPPRHWGRRILLVLAAAIVLLAASAPTILSTGPVRRYVLGAANARLPVRLEADGWALSWFGGQQVEGLSVRMPDGTRVATVARASLDENLLAILTDRSRLGPVHVEGGDVWTDGLKRAVEAFSAEEPDESPEPKPPMPPVPAAPFVVPDAVAAENLVIHAGPATVRVTQARFEKGTEADNVRADLHLLHGQASGTASIEAKVTGLSSGWKGPQALGVEGTVACTDLPVAALWAVAAELGVPFDGGGAVTAKAAFTRGRTGDVALRVTTFAATGLSVTGEALQGDTPTLETLALTADATYAGGLVTVKAFDLQAPVATMQARGTFALAATEAAQPTGTGSATVTLQIGRIAQMLPKTLGLHKDLTIEAGTLQATVEAASDEKRSRLTFDASLLEVRGTRGGERVALSTVRVAADLEREHTPPPEGEAPAPPGWLALAESVRVNELTATAAAGTIKAAGRIEAFTLDAQLDLAKATEEVGRFVDLEGYGAEGAARLGIKTEGTLASGVKAALTSDLKDLVLHLGGGSRLAEPRASLKARGGVTFDDQRRLSDLSLDAFDLDAATASLSAKGFLQRTMESWQFDGTANGTGTVANLGGLVAVIIALLDNDGPPQENADEAGADWRDTLVAYALRASGRGGKPAGGRWQLEMAAGGALDKGIAVTADASVADLVWPPAEPAAKPVQVADGTLHADVLYHPNEETAKITVRAIKANVAGVSAVVQGPATVELEGPATFEGTLDVVAEANLPTLAETLAPLGLLPEEATYSGDVKVRLTASPGMDARTLAKAKLTVVGEKVEVAWPDGRGFSDPLARFTAAADLLRQVSEGAPEPAVGLTDAADALNAVEVTEWSLATVAGSLKGTAGIKRAKTGWYWQMAAGGDGAIRPLAQTIAKLRGRPAGELRGLWNLNATYDSRMRELVATADATNLTVPQEGDEPKPDLRLDNIHLETTAAYTEDGLLRIDRADLTGPGIALKGKGTVRLPSDNTKAGADGTVTAKADLAQFSQVLAPFGLLPEGAQLAGAADFNGEVASQADGFGGEGVLEIANLDVQMTDPKTTIREPRVQLPVRFAYNTGKRRWDVSSQEMKAQTASGTWRVAMTETDADPLLEAACNLEFDAKRVRDVLGERLPATVRLSGPWRLAAEVAGPLPDAELWHRRIARLTGQGRLDVKRFEYETLTGGDGAVHWTMGEEKIRFSPDPAKPSRLALAGGHANLGGYVDLSGEVPRFVISERVQVLDGVPLEGKQVQDYLRYASPVLAASISAKGNLSVALDRLVVPLADDPLEKDLPEEQKTPVAKRVAAAGQYQIDDFQSELIGPLGKLIQVTGGPARTVVHPFGPIKVVMERGILSIEEHDLRYAEGVNLRFGGTIGVDKRMNVIIGVPLTTEMLQRHKVSASALPYLKDIVVAIPLTGTIDRPQIDDRAFAKRLADIAIEAIKRQTLERLGDWLKGTLKQN